MREGRSSYIGIYSLLMNHSLLIVYETMVHHTPLETSLET